MRAWLLIGFSCLLLLAASCGSNQTTQNGRKYFDYDELDYYFNDYDESQITDLYDNQSRSVLDSIKIGLILGELPSSINDQMSIDKLTEIGYRHRRIDKRYFSKIDQIFCEKDVADIAYTACIYIFRDVLVFKKRGKVVGMAKICFDCSAHRITGTAAKTESFGQNGDYSKLQSILKFARNLGAKH